MHKKIGFLPVCAIVVVAACLLLGGQIPLFGQVAEKRPDRECPYLIPINQGTKGEIVDVLFTDLVEGIAGNRLKIPDDKKDKARLAVVTMKFTKPAGERMSLAAADLTLHYYHGDKTEVAPCEALSSFSTILEVDRPVNVPKRPGPAFVKQTTGARSTKAGVVYIDAVFGWMEPDTKEVWVTIGQPITERPFVTQGWTP